MPPKPSVQPNPRPSSGKSKPISFRLDRQLVDHIDGIAKRLAVSRNGIVAMVLKEYVKERGDAEVERIVEQEANRANHVDLFA